MLYASLLGTNKKNFEGSYKNCGGLSFTEGRMRVLKSFGISSKKMNFSKGVVYVIPDGRINIPPIVLFIIILKIIILRGNTE